MHEHVKYSNTLLSVFNNSIFIQYGYSDSFGSGSGAKTITLPRAYNSSDYAVFLCNGASGDSYAVTCKSQTETTITMFWGGRVKYYMTIGH